MVRFFGETTDDSILNALSIKELNSYYAWLCHLIRESRETAEEIASRHNLMQALLAALPFHEKLTTDRLRARAITDALEAVGEQCSTAGGNERTRMRYLIIAIGKVYHNDGWNNPMLG
jgi:Lon protease-like protein